VLGPSTIEDFHFLSSRSYILAHEGDGEHRAGRIDIFTFKGDCVNSPIHVATLELPGLLPDAFISSMILQAGPFCANPLAGTPFSKSNDSRIYMFLVLYSDTVWCRLFVHHRWLYKYVLEHARERTTEVTVVPWDKWGPQNTRMLPGADHRWIRSVEPDPLNPPSHKHRRQTCPRRTRGTTL
jgi:hypothetical protein